VQYATETTIPSSSFRSAREIADPRDIFRHQITGLRYNEKEPDILMPPDREPVQQSRRHHEHYEKDYEIFEIIDMVVNSSSKVYFVPTTDTDIKGQDITDKLARIWKDTGFGEFCEKARRKFNREGIEGELHEITHEVVRMWNELDEDEQQEEVEKAGGDSLQKEYWNRINVEAHDIYKELYPNEEERTLLQWRHCQNRARILLYPIAPKSAMQTRIELAAKDKLVYQFFFEKNLALAANECRKGYSTNYRDLIDTWWYELNSDEDRNDELNMYTKMAVNYDEKKTGYKYFCSSNRDSVKEENPEMSSIEITKEFARQWKYLTQNEKNKWQDKSDRYMEATRARHWKELDEHEQNEEKMTAYKYFCTSNRASVKEENPEMSSIEITKELDKQWKELDEDEQNECKEFAKIIMSYGSYRYSYN
jgi:mRNA-degrading endonuclease RelE of RelBE toxin-antitoxin system